MYKIVITFLLLLKSFILFAEDNCYFNLLGKQWRNSYNHKLAKDDFTHLNLNTIKSIIANTLIKSQCNKPLTKDAVKGCASILSTIICRVDYIYGYFIVFPDGAESYNIVFNRWD
jgi:hypothetical protein